MRKIQILAHKGARNEIISALRERGALHITEPSIEFERGPDEEARRESERDLQARLGKLEHLRDFLKPYVPKEKKSLDTMFNPRAVLEPEELAAIVEGFDLEDWYQRVIALEGAMRGAEAEIGRKQSLASELTHWTGIETGVEELKDTRLVTVALVTVESSEVADLTSELAEATSESDLMEVSKAGSSTYLAVLFLKSAESSIAPILKRHNARWANLVGATGTPEVAAAALLEEADGLHAKIEELKKQAGELAREHRTVLVVLDEGAEALAKKVAEERFGTTRETFLVEGWIRGRDEDAVRARLTEIAPEVEFESREPAKGENVPIDLHNSGVVNAFEFVTTLYGRPSYWERDPTPLLAPFFIVFFGLCVSDGGYGLTLAALSFFLMTKMQPGGGRQLMKLLMMGGISTAVVGAVTGGWFGIDPSIMPGWLQGAIVMNPLQEPMKMLNVVFILGIIQIMTGLIIKMVADIRDGRWLDGILDQLLWVFFLVLLVPLGYSFILGGSVPDGVMATAGKGAMVVAALVVLTGARKNPNPIMKILGGVLKLYDVVGYFGDVLSYARLLALGLATGAIAMAINGVAQMAGEIPIVGPIAAIFVLIGGHLFNLAVNCLGGFVHSARLQYLEFFSKFFTGGGI
ncbi:MAG: V-type ATP synthase subunit I, partial [Candidatus Eisenbacteria bacterium]|nr:V-type ATP synthase subunit I [Candidatus Eisenbacteria bacterium]